MRDLAVVTQSPWLRGGLRTQLEAFWTGATRLGRRPHLLYIGHNARSLSLVRRSVSVAPAEERHSDLSGTAFPALLPELETVAHVAAAPRMAGSVRDAASAWVVTTSAHHGWPAARSGRRYACWVGTSLRAEGEARRNGLSPARRLALDANRPALRRLERDVLRSADTVYATSPYVRELVVEEAGLAANEVQVLPIPVDSNVFTPEPDEAWFARLERPVVVFVGRASDPRKNIRLLVDAFALLRRTVPHARLRLVGRVPAKPPADAEVLGEVPAVAPHLRTASLFVLPSLQEGFGVGRGGARLRRSRAGRKSRRCRSRRCSGRGTPMRQTRARPPASPPVSSSPTD